MKISGWRVVAGAVVGVALFLGARAVRAADFTTPDDLGPVANPVVVAPDLRFIGTNAVVTHTLHFPNAGTLDVIGGASVTYTGPITSGPAKDIYLTGTGQGAILSDIPSTVRQLHTLENGGYATWTIGGSNQMTHGIVVHRDSGKIILASDYANGPGDFYVEDQNRVGFIGNRNIVAANLNIFGNIDWDIAQGQVIQFDAPVTIYPPEFGREQRVNGGTLIWAGSVSEYSAGSGFEKGGAGLLVLSGTANYTGPLDIKDGRVRITQTSGFGSGSINFAGTGSMKPVLENSAAWNSFTRTVGAGVSFNGSGGFAARETDLTVDLGGAGATLVWDSTPGFLGTNQSLVFGSADADRTVKWVNPIDLTHSSSGFGTLRTVHVHAGTGTAPEAEMMGVISDAGGTISGLQKEGDGTLVLSAANNYRGETRVNAGTLRLEGAGLLGTGLLSVRNASVEVANGVAQTVNNISLGVVGGTLTSNIDLGGATLTRTGNISYSGGLQGTISNGTLAGSLLTMSVLTGSDVSGTDLVISANITGTGGVSKTGIGTAYISGNIQAAGPTAVSVSGGTLILGGLMTSSASATSVVVSNGTLRLIGTNGALMPGGTGSNSLTTGGKLLLDNTLGTNANRMSDLTRITFSRGDFALIGGNTPLVETIAAVSITSNVNSISVTRSGGVAAELNLGTLGRTFRGGIVKFGGDGDIRIGATATTTLSSNGVLAGFATWGADWVAVAPDGLLTPLATYETSTDGDAWSATENIDITGTATGPSATANINSLKISSASAVKLYDGLTLGILNRGILVTADGASLTGGSIYGQSASNDDYIIHVQGAGTTFTLGSQLLSTSGTSQVALSKAGSGVLVLNGGLGISTTNNLLEGTLRFGKTATITGALQARADTTLDINGQSVGLQAISSDSATASLLVNGGQLHLLAGSSNWTGQVQGTGSILTGGGNHTFSNSNSFSGGVTVRSGTLTLSTTNGSMRNATFTVERGGTLLLNNVVNANNLNRVSDTHSVTLRQGNVQFTTQSAGASTERMGMLVLAGGHNNITIAGTSSTNSGHTVTFSGALGGLNRMDNATVLFRSTSTNNALGGTTGSGTRVIFGGALTNSNDILGGWAYAQSTLGAPTDFARHDLGNGVRALGSVGAARPTQVASGTATSNVLTGTNVQNTLLGNTSIYSLNANSGTTTLTQNLGGFTLNVVSGGLIHSGTGTYIMSNGTVTAGQTNSAGTLYLYSDVNNNLALQGTGASVIRVEADLANNGAGPLTVVASGPGTVALIGAKSFTGDLIVNNGTVTTSTTNSLADSVDVVINGGTLSFGGTDTINSLTLKGGTLSGSIGTVLALTDYQLEHGSINRSLGGNVNLYKTTDGTVTLGANASFTGDVFINGGTLIVNGNERFSNNSLITVNGGVYDVNTRTDLIRGIHLVNGSITGTTGQLTVSTGGITVESGFIGVALASTNSGLTKQGAGTVLLTGSNNYTGGTFINAGTLEVSTDRNLGGAGGLTFGGGTLRVLGTGYASNTRSITLTDTGTFDIVVPQTVANGNYAFLAPVVTGAGTLVKDGEGTMALTAANAGFTGNMVINNGVLAATANGALGTGGITINGDGGLGLLNVTTLANNITVNGASASWNTGGSDLSFTGALNVQNGAVLEVITGGYILNIAPGASIAGSGTVNVAAGSNLRVNNTLNSLAAGTINVFGTLGGNAELPSANVVVHAGGSLAAGNSIGSMHVENLSLIGDSASDMAMWIVEVGPSLTADFVMVDGVLDLSSAFDELVVSDPASVMTGDVPYIIAGYGTLLGVFDHITGMPAGYVVDYNYRGQNLIALVPEPGTLLLMIAAAGALLRRRTRGRGRA